MLVGWLVANPKRSIILPTAGVFVSATVWVYTTTLFDLMVMVDANPGAVIVVILIVVILYA